MDARVLSTAVAALILSAATGRGQEAPSDYYQPFFAGHGLVQFSRPVADSTVLVLSIRYGPYKGDVEQSAEYELYLVRCLNSGRHGDYTAMVGLGHTEHDALQRGIAVRFGPPSSLDSAAEESLYLRRCGRKAPTVNEVTRTSAPKFDKHAFVSYWTSDHDARFLRVTSDSTVRTLAARYEPRGMWSIGVMFGDFVVHCAPRYEYAYLGGGSTEREVTARRFPPPYRLTGVSIADEDSDPYASLVSTACIELHRRQQER